MRLRTTVLAFCATKNSEFVQDDAPNHKRMARHTNWICKVKVPLSRVEPTTIKPAAR